MRRDLPNEAGHGGELSSFALFVERGGRQTYYFAMQSDFLMQSRIEHPQAPTV
jgi:hypothetical protein